MSAVQAFFKQRQRDQSSGKSLSETIAVLHGGAQPAFEYAHVAIQGCCHGELTRIYDACAAHEAETGKKIDFLICCGDFQAIRNGRDLSSMAVPDKYKALGDFPHYFAADGAGAPQRTAPYLTLFVGGNHENSDWLAEESYGGFLAPNIYYLGHSGVVEIELPIKSTTENADKTGVVVVGGLSGIFKGNDYERPYPARPYAASENGKRSAYHIRRIEQEKLEAFIATAARGRHAQHQAQIRPASTAATESTPTQSSQPLRPMEAPLIDVVVSHDWPVGITKLGDEEQLIRYKPFFKDDIAHNALGNPHTLALLRAARPRYWIAAHLHCFFSARVPVVVPPAQLISEEARPVSATTSFVALDKCAKGKGFLDFVDIPLHWSEAPPSTPPTLATSFPRVRRHPVWLDILRLSHSFVTQNEVGPDGFMAASAAATLHAQYHGADQPEHAPAAAQYAPNTASLLQALQLSPALPLQGTRRNESDVRADKQGPPFRPPWRAHGLDHSTAHNTGTQSRSSPYTQSRRELQQQHTQYSGPPQPHAHVTPVPSQIPDATAATTASACGALPTSAKIDSFEDVGDSPWVVDLGPGTS